MPARVVAACSCHTQLHTRHKRQRPVGSGEPAQLPEHRIYHQPTTTRCCWVPLFYATAASATSQSALILATHAAGGSRGCTPTPTPPTPVPGPSVAPPMHVATQCHTAPPLPGHPPSQPSAVQAPPASPGSGVYRSARLTTLGKQYAEPRGRSVRTSLQGGEETSFQDSQSTWSLL